MTPFEFLSTHILAVCNIAKAEVCINVSGDGVFLINEEIVVIEQGNKPDYVGYHIDKKFEDWYSQKIEKLYFSNVKQFAISSDGILSFAQDYKKSHQDIVPEEYLLLSKEFEDLENMLDRKCIELKKSFDLTPNDDVAIVKVVI